MNALVALGRSKEASLYFRETIKIREHIDPSGLPGITQRLADALMNESVALWAEGQRTEAEAHLRKAEQLLLSIPKDPRDLGAGVDFSLGQVSANWGKFLVESRRYRDAIDKLDAGLRRIEPRLKTEPNDAAARNVCLQLHGNRANAFMGLEQAREAAREWRRVVDLSDPPVPVGYRVLLALCLIHAGEDADALTQADLIQPSPAIAGTHSYDISCIYALAAVNLGKQPGMAVDERKRRCESHLSMAVRWLTCAANAGFFRDPAQRDHARKDPDLAILRDRDEFRQTIESNGAK